MWPPILYPMMSEDTLEGGPMLVAHHTVEGTTEGITTILPIRVGEGIIIPTEEEVITAITRHPTVITRSIEENVAHLPR